MDARKFVHTLGLRNLKDWQKYAKSENRPEDIPSSADSVYKDEWRGWGDWLGTGAVSLRDREYRPFEEARKFVHSLGLKNEKEWRNYPNSGKKPDDIPSHPDHVYKNDWKGMGDWLGTGRIADQKKVYRSFEKAKEFVHTGCCHSFYSLSRVYR